MPGDQANPGVRISFPVECTYHGAIPELAKRGRHFWIKDGRLGHGEFHLAHSIPLTQVASVEVTERQVPGYDPPTVMMPTAIVNPLGNPFGARLGPPARQPKQVTDIIVRTHRSQLAHWIVKDRSGDWVRDRIGPALRAAGVPLYGGGPGPDVA